MSNNKSLNDIIKSIKNKENVKHVLSSNGNVLVLVDINKELDVVNFFYPEIPNIDNYGDNIAISHTGNTIAVSSINEYTKSKRHKGIVYIYERKNVIWINTRILHGDLSIRYENFGKDIILDKTGNKLTISSYEHTFDYVDNEKDDSIYLYEFILTINGWVLSTKYLK
jgi:hypothetical protein